jgi:hypothetical protein
VLRILMDFISIPVRAVRFALKLLATIAEAM